MRRIARGLRMTAASWRIVRRHPRTLILPLIAIVLQASWVGGALALVRWLWTEDWYSRWTFVIAGALWALPATFTAIFLQVAFVAMIDARLRGEALTVRGALRLAHQRGGLIAAWTLVVVTVGLLFRVLENLPAIGGIAGRVVVWVVEGAWALATLLVVPVLVFERKSPFAAARRSVRLFRKTWGEEVTAEAAVGAAWIILGLPALGILCAGLTVLDGANALTGVVLIAIAAAILISWSAFIAAMEHTVVLGLYRFATGDAVAGYELDGALEEAFGGTWESLGAPAASGFIAAERLSEYRRIV